MHRLLICGKIYNGIAMKKSADIEKHWMSEAIKEAKKAFRKGEVPIGAIAVASGKIIGRAHNIRERTSNPLGHAELLLIEKLSKKRKSWRMEDATIYVTCEPCLMCAGAMLQARVPRVVYGCADPKAGAFGTLYDVSNDPRLNHRIEVKAGVLSEECAWLLSEFFRNLRKKKGWGEGKSCEKRH